MKILLTWIGTQDIDASAGRNQRGPGPVASALEALDFELVVLLSNQGQDELERFSAWLRPQHDVPLQTQHVGLDSPTDFGAIYQGVDRVINKLLSEHGDEIPELTFHLSPGTSQMAAVWILLSASKYPATLIQSSPEVGVETVTLPFEIAAELVPKMLQPADVTLTRMSAALAGGSLGEFTYQSPAMDRLMKKAHKAALRSIPVLIEGEPGTEKAQLAFAIHQGGSRATAIFERFNCGAVPSDQLGLLLFGTETSDEPGAYNRAQNGTLYLEEIEHLPPELQARLQRVTEQQNDNAPRLITSSRTNLLEQVAQGTFREELFYTLAVVVLKLPPVRERTGDLSKLLDQVLVQVNEQSRSEPGFIPKHLSPAAKNFLLQQRWPGNVRELENTLRRAVVWSDSEEISEADVWDALLVSASRRGTENDILGRPIEEGVDIQSLVGEVARHYILRAIEYSEGNKSQAAKLVGLPSYQTLTNWMKKYEL